MIGYAAALASTARRGVTLPEQFILRLPAVSPDRIEALGMEGRPGHRVG